MCTPLRLLSAAALAGVFAVPAYAQGAQAPAPGDAAPPSLNLIEGRVDVEQDGVIAPADPPMMLIAGDAVRTRDGRAEIVFGDGTLLHLGPATTLEILDDEHLRLTAGRAVVRLSYAAPRPYVVDTPVASVRLEAEGEYHLDVDPSGPLVVAVSRGTANIGDPSRPTVVSTGLMATLAAPDAGPVVEPYNAARWDAFERWASDRATAMAASTSAARLPYELRPYAPVLDQYGRWDYVAPYGSVWIPSVDLSWRPYYDGWWSFTHYGWTWRGRDRFAWPTHHYGRWEFNGRYWFWIPGRTWAPAWVSWSSAPGFIGWSPLGWDGRPVGWRRGDHPVYFPHYSPWRAWTIVPRDHFAPKRNARRFAIDGDRLDDFTRRRLIDQRAVPVLPDRGVAVPRRTFDGAGSRGNVRRPPSTPSRGVPASTIRRVRPGEPADSPVYAPPRSWTSGGDRPGTVRSPGGRDTTRSDRPSSRWNDGSRRGATTGAVPRSTGSSRGVRDGSRGSGSPPPSVRSGSGQGGAVRRPPAASRPSGRGGAGGAVAPGPPTSGKGQPSRGGAVRRPPGA